MVNKSFEEQTKLIVSGFDNVNKNFESVNRNFESVNKNFESVNKNFEKVFGVLKVMDEKIDDLSSIKHRVEYIENVLNIQPIKK
jgi:phage-related minor tail protein